MKNIFTILPNFLRNPDYFFKSIRDGEQVESKALTLSLASFLFLLVYGFMLGLTKSPLQAVSSAIKIPVLFLSSMAFCLPALYFFSLALLGTPLRMIQVLATLRVDNWMVRSAAAEALSKIGDSRANRALAAVRKRAAEALRRIDPTWEASGSVDKASQEGAG